MILPGFRHRLSNFLGLSICDCICLLLMDSLFKSMDEEVVCDGGDSWVLFLFLFLF